MRSSLRASGCARAPCLLRGVVDWSSCGELGRGYKEVKQLMRKGVARSSFWASRESRGRALPFPTCSKENMGSRKRRGTSVVEKRAYPEQGTMGKVK